MVIKALNNNSISGSTYNSLQKTNNASTKEELKLFDTSKTPNNSAQIYANNSDNEGNQSGFISKITNKIKEHPILTILSVGVAAAAGIFLYRYAVSLKSSVNIPKLPEPALVSPPKIEIPEPDFSNPEIVKKVLEEGIEYEHSIGFTNLEIFKDVPEAERKRILGYFKHLKKEQDLLLFACGEKPSMFEGIKGFNYDVFDALRSPKVRVSEYFAEEKSNFIINKEAVKKLITKNREIFRVRLGLPQDCPIDKIINEATKSWNSPLCNPKKFADLRHILTGGELYDAFHIQLVEDLKRKNNGVFHPIYAKTLDNYKKLLKDMVMDPGYTYGNLSEEFRKDLIQKIDTLTEKTYGNIIEEPIRVFEDAAYEAQQAESLKTLAKKLFRAKEFGDQICLS